MVNLLKNIGSFYIDGFKNMTLGKSLWLLIGIKLFIMFAVVKPIFFPNLMKTNFDNDKERGDFVIDNLISEH